MKKIVLATFIISLFAFSNGSSQTIDASSGMEFIFGGAQIKNNDGSSANIDQAVRFSAFLHIQQQIYYNFNKSIGLYSGLAIRNVGYITKNGTFTDKYRMYTAGIPLALTVGNLEKHFFLYAGAEAGLAFHYKEKHFNGEDKTKSSAFFSGKINAWQPQLFAGIQFPYGANVKFAYYPQNFFNKDYTENIDGVDEKPYQDGNINLYYVSLSFQLFKSDAKKISGESVPENRTAYR